MADQFDNQVTDFDSNPYSSDPVYETNPLQVGQLIGSITSGKLGLPDFQRDFTWEPRRTAELLTSIMRRFPVGTLLFWDIDKSDEQLKTRQFAGTKERGPTVVPDQVVLDGQQRLTSILHSLAGGGSEFYFLNLESIVSDGWREMRPKSEIDWDNSIHWIGRSEDDNLKQASDRNWQLDNAVLPLNQIWKVDQWIVDFSKRRSIDGVSEQEILDLLWFVRDTYLNPLRTYGFPVIELPKETEIEAVCTVFETLNRTAKPLGVFELLTARFFPKKVYLRDLWEQATIDFPSLSEEDFDLDPYSVLQATSLRARNSAQRADVLKKLTAEEVEANWDKIVGGLDGVLKMLESECGVLTKKLLPYGMVLLPMAATWPEIQDLKPIKQGPAKERLRQYFWCTVFTSNFDQGANSQAGADYIKLKKWLPDEGEPAPEAVAAFSLTRSTIANATTRRKALYAAILALTVRLGARDFHDGEKITRSALLGKEIDSHHVFPKAYLSSTTSELSPELILNRTLIDKTTNQSIGKKAPSVYLEEISSQERDTDYLDIFKTHLIDAAAGGCVQKNDYDGFISDRLDRVVQGIEDVTSHAVFDDMEKSKN